MNKKYGQVLLTMNRITDHHGELGTNHLLIQFGFAPTMAAVHCYCEELIDAQGDPYPSQRFHSLPETKDYPRYNMSRHCYLQPSPVLMEPMLLTPWRRILETNWNGGR